jgi:hypothetical protein
MEDRFPWKPDMKLQNALFHARDTMAPIEKPHSLELPAQMRVQVDNGVAEAGKRPCKLMGPLYAGVPIVHGIEDDGAITTLERTVRSLQQFRGFIESSVRILPA